MKKTGEFKIALKGNYDSINDAKHALQDPFVEDFVEETGHFRLQDFENIRVASGITLSDLEIAQTGENTFDVYCKDSAPVLSKRRAEELVEMLEDHRMFYDIEIVDYK